MEVLPDNVLFVILQLIEPVERLGLERVCRRWRRLTTATWRHIRKLQVSDKDVLSILLWKCGVYLTDLKITFTGSGHYAGALSLGNTFQLLSRYSGEKLKNLTVANYREDSDLESLRFLTELNQVQSICLLNPLPRIMSLITDEYFTEILRLVPNLKRLKVAGAPYLQCGFLTNLSLELEEFHFDSRLPRQAEAGFPYPVFRSLNFPSSLMSPNYGNIRKLVLGEVRVSNSQFSHFCERAVSLECLHIQGQEFVNENLELICLGLLRSLKILHVINCGALIGDSAVHLISINCVELQILRLYRCAVTDAAVCDLRNLKQLRILDLSCNSLIHDWSLITSLPVFAKLESLFLCYCDNLSGIFLPLALQFCEFLVEIGLSSREKLNENLIELCADTLANRDRILTIRASISSFTVAKLFASTVCQNLPLSLDLTLDEAEHNHETPPEFNIH